MFARIQIDSTTVLAMAHEPKEEREEQKIVEASQKVREVSAENACILFKTRPSLESYHAVEKCLIPQEDGAFLTELKASLLSTVREKLENPG